MGRSPRSPVGPGGRPGSPTGCCAGSATGPRCGGGPVGLSTLAVAVGEESETVETVAEPFLVREGFMIRTPRGRAAAPLAWTHLGLTPPPPEAGNPQALPLLLGDGDGRFGG